MKCVNFVSIFAPPYSDPDQPVSIHTWNRLANRPFTSSPISRASASATPPDFGLTMGLIHIRCAPFRHSERTTRASVLSHSRS